MDTWAPKLIQHHRVKLRNGAERRQAKKAAQLVKTAEKEAAKVVKRGS
jgi:hypothetical protein